VAWYPLMSQIGKRQKMRIPSLSMTMTSQGETSMKALLHSEDHSQVPLAPSSLPFEQAMRYYQFSTDCHIQID